MEYERNFRTGGEFKGQDITFMFFDKSEANHEQYFLELTSAINIFVEPSLEVRPYEAVEGHCWVINRYLSEPEIYELTDGCPNIRLFKTRLVGKGVKVKPQYL